MKEAKLIGRINKWFEDGRNYGFIKELNSSNSHFLHPVNIISGTPATGAVVRFETQRTSRGFTAINVEVYSSRQELERADAAAALVDSTTSTTSTTEVSREQ